MSHRLTVLMEYLAWAMKHGAAWLLLLLAAAGVGSLALRKLRFHSRIEGLVFTLATGLGLWALGLFALGLVGLLNRPVIWSLTLACALISLRRIVRSANEYRDAVIHSWRKSGWLERCLFFGVAGLALAYGGALLLLAQYPPLQWDAIASHLVLAREYLEGHRVIPLRSVPHPILPALNHMLFSWALALLDDILAQMVEYTFMTLTALGLFAWGQRLERPLLGFAAATLWLAHPIVLWLGGSAYIDIGLTCFAFLGVYAMRVFWDKGDANWWTLGLALFVMSAGVKLPGLFFVALGAGIGLWSWMRSGISGRAFVRGLSVASVIGLPWFAFITFHTGNPFWPLIPQLSRGSWGPTNSVEDLNKYLSYGGTKKTFWNFLQAPIHLVTRANLFVPDNQRGLAPAIALLPLAWIIALWHRSTRWWAMWLLAYTAFWYYNASFMRYWLPVAPLAGLALYEGLQWVLDRVTKSANAQRVVWMVIALAAMGYGLRSVKTDYEIKGRPPITTAQRQEFLSRLCEGYSEIDYINRNAQPGDSVYLINGNYLAYYIQPQYVGSSEGLPIDPGALTLIWAEDSSPVKQVNKKNATWVAVRHGGMGPPKNRPPEQPGNVNYELVKIGAGAFVFHRTPLPAGLSLDVAESRRGQSDPCPAREDSGYEGFVDTATCRAISGWAWDTTRPDCVVNLDVYDGQTLLATITAKGLRHDLAVAGKGSGNHAFTWPMPMELIDGKRRDFRFVVSGSNFMLNGGARSLSCHLRN